ncbi:haloacid dehalogenase [Salinigranum rubrum]|uniref:Haloacid dehalogenase n=1 Tax=Salinigranum rubrum TaxID=755307 RepID=A0A2I8VM37_9EURY|nr:HAD family hydrolase [Salinigranum rubrum]AUV82944.1 haloacid dehalogenase [Salinigranum rubrum]
MTATPVDTVLFDLDDTLVTYNRSTAELLDESFGAVGVDPFFSAEAYFSRYEEFLPTTDSMEALREACFAAIADDSGRDPSLGRDVARAFNARRDHGDVRLLPGARDVLDAFADEYRLGIVTNGPPDVQRPKLVGAGLDETFETVVFAGYDTEPKPKPEPFRRALAALDSSADRAAHVGNSLASDVAGAHAAGLRSVWVPAYEESVDVTPHLRLDSLDELTEHPWK